MSTHRQDPWRRAATCSSQLTVWWPGDGLRCVRVEVSGFRWRSPIRVGGVDSGVELTRPVLAQVRSGVALAAAWYPDAADTLLCRVLAGMAHLA